MNRKILTFVIIVLVIIFSSCEKIIDLKLDKTEPKIVIESFFTDINTRHTVSISSTVDFNANNTKVPVVGAVVTIKEENGPTINFTEPTPGSYLSSRYRGVPGRKYTLTVIANGKTYVASSVMPLRVDIKSLTQTELSFFNDIRKVVKVNYKDPEGVSNFYYYRVFSNNVKRDSFFLDSDRFNDGREISNTIYLDDPALVTDDVVRVQLLTIDENVYKYFFSITQITGNGGPPTTPANPTSNFNNGALGYFSASTSSETNTTIQ